MGCRALIPPSSQRPHPGAGMGVLCLWSGAWRDGETRGPQDLDSQEGGKTKVAAPARPLLGGETAPHRSANWRQSKPAPEKEPTPASRYPPGWKR